MASPVQAPEVSIVLPVYNAEAFLDEAFRSVLEQTFLKQGGRLEVSVFDDGSSDGSARIIEAWRQRLCNAYPSTMTFTYGVNSARLEAARRGEKRAEAYAKEEQEEKEDVETAPLDTWTACGLCGERRPESELAAKKKSAKPGAPLYCSACCALSKEEWQAKRQEVYSKRAAGKAALEPAAKRSPAVRSGVPCGIGFACNSSVRQSNGEFLCRFDADDVMHPDRILLQLAAVQALPEGERDRTLVGSGFVRTPEDATPRYTRWLNEMTDDQLMSHRFREVSLLHPTWLYHRRIWERVGGYTEDTSVGEDIVFFHRHLESNGLLHRIQKPLLTYRCHPGQRSWRLPRRAVQDAKVAAFERQVLQGVTSASWQEGFAVVGAGRDARDFARALSLPSRALVKSFHEVDPKKIGKTIALQMGPGEAVREVPILEQARLTVPFVVCVALERGYGVRRTIAEGVPGAVDGVDYFHLV
eukprot:TRINITY_DN112222_c0_g1_i1.p1 TRINITY_DN112222_c0_g1~~TRINITY_DN112222_c0_g1_i1.p1  ORF type:complete len:471 (-),score=104.10 TRINITY_DN112222_c0_g1_i1:111-1523(-)